MGVLPDNIQGHSKVQEQLRQMGAGQQPFSLIILSKLSELE